MFSTVTVATSDVCDIFKMFLISDSCLASSLQWMNPRTLVCLDKSEKIHVLDVRSEEELEVCLYHV